MKIAIIGLGLIGGSIAKALSSNYYVEGFDVSNKILNLAITEKTITAKLDFKNINTFDIAFLAVPPLATKELIKSFKNIQHTLFCDVCGVKKDIYDTSKVFNINYLGFHPMAGKEVGGYQNSNKNLFVNKSLILTSQPNEFVKELIEKLGFNNIVVSTPEIHDKTIAYTSQLCHIISNCYAKCGEGINTNGFTGGSFEDIVRVGELDSKLWTELFLSNSAELENKLDEFIDNLVKIKNALTNNNTSELEVILKSGSNMAKILKK